MALMDTILRGTHPGTIPARFGLIWFSGFRGEDLNVIFYQNMPNLHNQYKSDILIFSSETTGPIGTKICGMVLGWPPSKFVSSDPDFQPRWPPSSK
jgi:hypothetical protein